MQNLESINRQIAVTADLRDIMKTMRALSAASIHQYEKAVESLRDYHRTVEMGLHVVLRDAPLPAGWSQRRVPAAPAGAILFGSDHGLCGRFNDDLLSHFLKMLKMTDQAEQKSWRLLTVGARIQAGLDERGIGSDGCMLVPGTIAGITPRVEQILLHIDQWQREDGIERVFLLHNRPAAKNTYRQATTRLLPIDFDELKRARERVWPPRSLPMFTMDRERLLSALLRQYFFVSIYRSCAESLVSEHTARLVAMQGAVRNTETHLQELQSEYQRLRQASITEELLDIVSGFEAVADRR